MPRLQPAPGYITAKTAMEMLDISDATLSGYVKKGWLKRYGPPERHHKFYKLSEVEAILLSRNTFDEYQEKLPAFFETATLEDIAMIVDIDERTFNTGHDGAEPRDFYMQWLQETYLRWMKKNPQAFSVLRNNAKRVVGYSILLPLKKEAMDRFIRDEISMRDIPNEDIELFQAGHPLHVYVIAVCVDPVYRSAAKREYGAKLIRGLFRCILDFAEEGVEIEDITARSYKPDGKRLMREMGMTLLRSPVPNKELFSLRVGESGYPFLIKYSDRLAEWKRERALTQ